MTTVHINIVNPTTVYNDLNISHEHCLSESDFLNALKAELKSALSKHGVKNVTIGVHKNQQLYDIIFDNYDPQEENGISTNKYSMLEIENESETFIIKKI